MRERTDLFSLPLKDLFLFARRQSSLDMSHDNHHCYFPSVICETTYCSCRQTNAEMNMCSLGPVHMYPEIFESETFSFRIQKFHDHTYSVNPAYESAT